MRLSHRGVRIRDSDLIPKDVQPKLLRFITGGTEVHEEGKTWIDSGLGKILPEKQKEDKHGFPCKKWKDNNWEEYITSGKRVKKSSVGEIFYEGRSTHLWVWSEFQVNSFSNFCSKLAAGNNARTDVLCTVMEIESFTEVRSNVADGWTTLAELTNLEI